MASGIVKNWKHAIGFFYSAGAMPFLTVINIIKEAIDALEQAGLVVLGITSDQGSNFQKAFRMMGSNYSNPLIKHNGQEYLIFKDPPHLIKNARNLLYRQDVKIPNVDSKTPAKWQHLKDAFDESGKSSLKIMP